MRPNPKAAGFSLLELVLALALSVIVLSAITGAIRLYFFQLERQADEVQRRQVVNGIIQMLGDDLRQSLQFKPQDYAGLENLVTSQAMAGIDGGSGTSTAVPSDPDQEIDGDALTNEIFNAVNSGGGDAVNLDNVTQSASSTSTGGDDSETVRSGMIGGPSFLRVDISRLPRVDQYNPLVIGDDAPPLLSDVKSVTYFFSADTPTVVTEFDAEIAQQGGLYRRTVDRAVEDFQNSEGEVDITLSPDQYSVLLSPEVAGIEFRYWDGEDWLNEWDSEEMLGFPSAIQVAIEIDPDRYLRSGAPAGLDSVEAEVTSMVISLPMAEILEDLEDPESEGSSNSQELANDDASANSENQPTSSGAPGAGLPSANENGSGANGGAADSLQNRLPQPAGSSGANR